MTCKSKGSQSCLGKTGGRSILTGFRRSHFPVVQFHPYSIVLWLLPHKNMTQPLFQTPSLGLLSSLNAAWVPGLRDFALLRVCPAPPSWTWGRSIPVLAVAPGNQAFSSLGFTCLFPRLPTTIMTCLGVATPKRAHPSASVGCCALLRAPFAGLLSRNPKGRVSLVGWFDSRTNRGIPKKYTGKRSPRLLGKA